MCCKGKEIPCHDPRNKHGLALAYGAGPIGPDYCVIEHDFDYSPVGFDYILDNSRSYGMLERTPETGLNPAKARQVAYLHRWWSGSLESLLFDLFGIAPARYMPPTRVEQLIRGITGWDMSILEIMLIGERRINMLQEFNRRAGLTRKDDFLPERFYKEPIPEGAYKDAVIDLDEYSAALHLYYAINGWNNEGVPGDAKLYELELDWIIEQRREKNT
jgi:aldehyde:ferredoxin oxidoreductase